MPEFESLSFEEKRAVTVFENMYNQQILRIKGEFNIVEFAKRMDRGYDVCNMLRNKIRPFIYHLTPEA